MFQKIKKHLFVHSNYPQLLHLKLTIQSKDPFLKELYKRKAENNNQMLLNKSQEFPRYFELNCPDNMDEEEDDRFLNNDFDNFKEQIIKKGNPCYFFHPFHVDFHVKISLINMITSNGTIYPSSIHLLPSTFLSKTPLRFINTGNKCFNPSENIIGNFDVLLQAKEFKKEESFDYWIDAYSPMIQIQSPSLEPIFVEIL